MTWFGEFMRWLAEFAPRMEVCRKTHGGVRFRRGKHVLPVKPGLYVYWPLVTEVELIPMVRSSVDLPTQSLTTKDGKSVAVSAVLVIEIADAVKALTVSHDYSDTVQEIAGASVARIVLRHRWTELRSDKTTHELTKLVRRQLKPYGVEVIEAYLTDLTKNQVIRTMGDGAPVVVAQEEEDV